MHKFELLFEPIFVRLNDNKRPTQLRYKKMIKKTLFIIYERRKRKK